jgi:murein DD-endopeptidase MepM/ murein hydrolase activator NlpD
LPFCLFTIIQNMSFKFVGQPLLTGRYEPEGLYLHSPLDARCTVLMRWGDQAEFYARFTYHGVPVKGHPGLDLAIPVGTRVLAVDQGRVMESNFEPQGFGRYLKLEHSWGESFYAHLEEPLVDAGQIVARGEAIALSGDNQGAVQPHLHFAIRIRPYNRFDGWGGFSDPLPFLSTTDLSIPEDDTPETVDARPTPLLVQERSGMRRP